MIKINQFITKVQAVELTKLSKDETLQGQVNYMYALSLLCKNNFPVLLCVLGYLDIGEFHMTELNYLKSLRNTGSSSVENLWLWFRGGFKTSIITVAHSIYLIINNPNIRILVESNTIDISKMMVKEIKSHFTNNALFRSIFRELCPVEKGGKIEFGTEETFTVFGRTKTSLKEPTVKCAGQGTNLTGLHFDWIKADDMVTKDSVSNDTQIQASKDHFASFRSLFDNPMVPRIDVVGTTYHFNDLYQDIMKQSFYRKSVIPVRVGEKLTFPERHTSEALVKIEEDPTVGPYEFAAQYLMTPLNPKDIKFKPEWLKTYDVVPVGAKEYICVDPASTQTKKSDYTVIERWAVDSAGKHYLIEGVRDRISALGRIDTLFAMVRRAKNLVWVKYEVLGGRHGDMEVIKQKMMTDKIWFLIKETKATQASKKDRIEQRLVGQWANGVCHLPVSSIYSSVYDNKVHDFVQEYKSEYLQFPFSEHDDILDCHSQMFEEAVVRGTASVPTVKKEGMTADDWERMYKQLDSERKRFPHFTEGQVRERLYVHRVQRMLSRV